MAAFVVPLEHILNLPKRGIPTHDVETCHRCQRGRRISPMTDDQRRELCNELAGDGWSVDYLAHRFHVNPKNGGAA